MRKSLINIFLGFLITTLFVFSSFLFLLCSYNENYMNAKNLEKGSDEYITFKKEYYKNNLSSRLIDKLIKDKDIDVIRNSYVDSLEHMQKMGFEFYDGVIELTDNGVFISDFNANYLLLSENIVDENYNIIYKEDYNFEQVVGFYINIYNNYFKICGIYKTPVDINKNHFYKDSEDYERANFYTQYIYLNYYKTGGLYSSLANINNNSLSINNDYLYQFKVDSVNKSLKENIFINKACYSSFGNLIIGDSVVFDNRQKDIYDHDVFLKKFSFWDSNGVYVSLKLYNLLFNETYSKTDFVNSAGEIIKYPEHIGKNISISVTDKFFKDDTLLFQDKKLLGIVLNYNDIYDEINENNGLLLSVPDYSNLEDFSKIETIIIKASSIKNKVLFFEESNKYKLRPVYSFQVPLDALHFVYNNYLALGLILIFFLSVIIFFISILYFKSKVDLNKLAPDLRFSLKAKSYIIIKKLILKTLLIITPSIFLTIVFKTFALEFINKLFLYKYSTSYLLFYRIPNTVFVYIICYSFLLSIFFIIKFVMKERKTDYNEVVI